MSNPWYTASESSELQPSAPHLKRPTTCPRAKMLTALEYTAAFSSVSASSASLAVKQESLSFASEQTVCAISITEEHHPKCSAFQQLYREWEKEREKNHGRPAD